MTSFIQNALRGYQTLITDDQYADPRTKDWFLISRPSTVVMILAGYLYFCLKGGPQFMEGRKPYQLKNTLIVYNAFQVILSSYMTYEAGRNFLGFNWLCEPIDYSNNDVACLAWVYFIAKITELLDTVFFVLRKKYNQISFLHLFHHTIMVVFVWVGVRYVAGGQALLLGVINSFVHVIMYSYYLVSGLGPEYQKYLWWKKHLTALQLVQFVILFFHHLIPLCTSCSYPKYLNVLFLVMSCCFIYMFGSFYIENYNSKSKPDSNKKQ